MITAINFSPGDTVRVFQKIHDDATEVSGKTHRRTQVFEGQVLGVRGRGENKSFMVRKVVGDIAVERIWPIGSPNIEKVVVKEKSKKKVRRAKLYFVRNIA